MTMVINIFVKTCFKHLESKSSEEQFSLVGDGERVGDGKAVGEILRFPQKRFLTTSHLVFIWILHEDTLLHYVGDNSIPS